MAKEKEEVAKTRMGKLDTHLSSLWVIAALFIAVFVTICIYVYAGEQEELPERKFGDISVNGRATTGSGFVASNNLKILTTAGISGITTPLETNTKYFVEEVLHQGGTCLQLPVNATHGDTINIFGTSAVSNGSSLYILAPHGVSFNHRSVLTRSFGASGRTTGTQAGSETNYNSIRIIGETQGGGGAGYNIDCTYIDNRWFAYGNFFNQNEGTESEAARKSDGTAWGGPGGASN